MPLDYARLMGLPPRVTRQTFTQRDTILYALGVGVGQDLSRNPEDLKFVYEKGLEALPTMAVILAYPGFWQKEPEYHLTWQKLVHGEQSLTLHGPLAVAGTVRGEMTIEAIYDKGADKGALLCSRREIYDDATSTHLATVRQSSFLRADGGFGGNGAKAPPPHAMPARDPDVSELIGTRTEQALIYRLSGDDNPLHADPEVAASAGFEGPILHGLCTYAIAGRALLKRLCGNVPARLRRMDARFSSPVFPGEAIRVDLWNLGDGKASFRASVPARERTVVDNGYAEYVA
jgi:acyl dehydratase